MIKTYKNSPYICLGKYYIIFEGDLYVDYIVILNGEKSILKMIEFEEFKGRGLNVTKTEEGKEEFFLYSEKKYKKEIMDDLDDEYSKMYSYIEYK